MKKTIWILPVIMVLLFSCVNFVSAQEKENAGVMPDSPFWGLDQGIERFQLMFTNNLEKKIMLRLQFADERLEEAKIMLQENKGSYFTLAENERKILVDEAIEESRNITLNEEQVRIQNRFNLHTENIEQVREQVQTQNREQIQDMLGEQEQAQVSLAAKMGKTK